MPEYIEREKAIKQIREVYEFEYPTASGAFDEFATILVPRIIKHLPAADAAEVKHGEWVEKPHISNEYKQCSVCKYDFSRFEPDNYCPNCGAKMDLKEGTTNA